MTTEKTNVELLYNILSCDYDKVDSKLHRLQDLIMFNHIYNWKEVLSHKQSSYYGMSFIELIQMGHEEKVISIIEQNLDPLSDTFRG